MRQVGFKGKMLDVPECVDELTPEQFSYYVVLASGLASGALSVEHFAVRWFSFLIGLGAVDFISFIPEISDPLMEQSISLARGFYDIKNGRVIPNFSSCRNLIPELEGYKGPNDWLNGLPFGKFMECMALIGGAQEGADEREAFNGIARVLYSIPEDKPVPEMLSWYAPLLFGNVWQAIQSGPIDINGAPIDFSIIFKPSGGHSKADDHTGWTGVAFEVASAGLFGPMSELEQVDFWAVLLYLYKCKFEYIHESK